MLNALLIAPMLMLQAGPVKWETDFDKAMKLARTSKRPLLVDFMAPW